MDTYIEDTYIEDTYIEQLNKESQVCCGVVGCAAVRCSLMQYVAVCCSVLQSRRMDIQGGEDSWDPYLYRSFSAKVTYI